MMLTDNEDVEAASLTGTSRQTEAGRTNRLNVGSEDEMVSSALHTATCDTEGNNSCSVTSRELAGP